MTIHYKARVPVFRLEERFQTVTGTKDDTGKFTTTTISLGWWALLDTEPKIWIFIGAEPKETLHIIIEAKWEPK